MATAGIEQLHPLAVIEEQLARGSTGSLLYYLGKVVIQAEPEPKAWELLIEPWQVEQLVRPIAPAIENVAGLRRGYTGPRDFWFELPKGHDKTSFIGRLANWIVGFSPKRLYGAIGASSVEQAARLLERSSEEGRLNPWLRRRVEHSLKVMRGPGGVMQVISSDAPKSSGRTDDIVICDELTFWESRALWDVLRPGRIKRRNQVFIVITNAGVIGTWQWEMREHARTSPDWHFYASPQWEFLASWMNEHDVAALEGEVNPLMRRRVIGNEWVHATENPLLTPELVHACVGKCLWKKGGPKADEKIGDLYIGHDVGATADRSVVSVVELRGETAYLRRLIVWDKKPLEWQQAELGRIIERYRKWLRRVQVDRGGIGYQIAQTMERRHPGLVQGVTMSQLWQGKAAGKLYGRFESGKIVTPNDEALNADLQQVEQVGTTRGGQPIVETARSDVGHADRFWSLALALDAMPERQRSRVGRAPRGVRARV